MALPGDRLGNTLPELDMTDPASLAAWYSGFAFVEHYRKVVLANCYEIQRALHPKTSESRLKELARLHPNYLNFLALHLQGRMKWEQNVIDSRYGA